MIRPATIRDLEAIDQIYDEIFDQEEARPQSFTNWARDKYPTVHHARAALDAGTLWVGEEDGELYGAMILNDIQLEEYDEIQWKYIAARDRVAVIHTLVISPRWHGKGKGREMVHFCEEESRRQGKYVIRLDTYEGNHPANAMYHKLGYRLAGATEFFFQGFIHEILNCYEKSLDA